MFNTAFRITIFTLGIIIAISSCKEGSHQVVTEHFPNQKPKLVKFYSSTDTTLPAIKEVQYYQSGQKKYQGHYKDSLRDGEWIFWFANGQVWSKGYYSKGLRTGITIVYHENGQLFYKGEYFEGQKHGKWEFYNQEGEQTSTMIFDKGRIAETKNEFSENE